MVTLEELDRPQLVRLASEKYGLQVDSGLSEKAIRRTLAQIDDNKFQKSKTQNEESTKMIVDCAKRNGKEEPVAKVRFMNSEFINADLKFSYDGGYGVKGPKNKKGLDWCPTFHLFPDQVYYLPLCVIEHLQELVKIDNKTTTDPETGQISSNTPVISNRFVLSPVLDRNDYAKLGA